MSALTTGPHKSAEDESQLMLSNKVNYISPKPVLRSVSLELEPHEFELIRKLVGQCKPFSTGVMHNDKEDWIYDFYRELVKVNVNG